MDTDKLASDCQLTLSHKKYDKYKNIKLSQTEDQDVSNINNNSLNTSAPLTKGRKRSTAHKGLSIKKLEALKAREEAKAGRELTTRSL